MNDSRFVELLNLYVDREITPAEAAELEAEALGSPERRRLFNQYCRLDRACTLVLTQGRASPAPKLAAALAAADGKVENFPEQSAGPGRLIFLGGMLAAAAAIIVAFYPRGAGPAPAVTPPVVPAPAAVYASSNPMPTGREEKVMVPFGTPSLLTATTVQPGLAWLKQELTAMAPITDDDLKLVRRSGESFSSGLANWGLHREGTFQKAGASRPPTELNAFEIGK